MTIVEQVVHALQQLGPDDQQQVLDYVRSMTPKTFTARDLLTLPPAQRQQLIQEAFRRAEDEAFETFEAYSEEAVDD